MSDFKPTYLPSRRPAEVVDCRELTDGVVRLTLRDEFIAANARPAQFVNLYTTNEQRLSPRPFGVCQAEGDTFTLMFAVVGKGTEEFRHLRPGQTVDVLGPLGHGFDLTRSANYVLVGGGLGVPPLIRTAQELKGREDAGCTVLFGYRNVHFADDDASRWCDDVRSIDESEGNVVALLDRWAAENGITADRDGVLRPVAEGERPFVILTCGPLGMMKAVSAWARERGLETQASLESRMGCGFGTCVVCTVHTTRGILKTCHDGPVFNTAELEGWEAAR
ncbi:2-polyprenylphenol hydroxylase [Pseudoscardovia radai]|uniref:2-polyprenylphenol hydroxylase n=1 Tax=Pseudoscardovia radai TaxID=987066 RepID=A0A261EXE1_9BIFI|nr:dihydroorotate dehydrogenase electron transfer subunit [Pseudoscardovia radai]OZG51518.1 2-polyprenylphenol hydroxylase [Pseudoscardovia radai]